jgi:hypothetical protein
VVPTDPVLRAAWKTVVALFAARYPSKISVLHRVDRVDRRHLSILRREADSAFAESPNWNGLGSGPQGRKLAVDPRLIRRVSRALRRRVVPAYSARYLFYDRAGRLFWPHSDDPKYAIKLLLCLDREPPADASSGSAFIAYRPDGSLERYELSPGSALAVESVGLVHGREPLKPGERVTILSIQLQYADEDDAAVTRRS